MDAENNFIKFYEHEKNIEVIMNAYYTQFGNRLSADKYLQMVKNYYSEVTE